jgi:1,4-alpha-glucan branching enzyme
MAMALSIALCAAAAAACATALGASAPAVTAGGVQFTFEDARAESVAVAGSFNGWSADAHPLARTRQVGVWSIVVPLPPGEHLFMYVVDGERWITPPIAEDYVDDGFGEQNGVVIVRPHAE